MYDISSYVGVCDAMFGISRYIPFCHVMVHSVLMHVIYHMQWYTRLQHTVACTSVFTVRHIMSLAVCVYTGPFSGYWRSIIAVFHNQSLAPWVSLMSVPMPCRWSVSLDLFLLSDPRSLTLNMGEGSPGIKATQFLPKDTSF